MAIRITAAELVEETQILEQLIELLVEARASRPDRPPLSDTLDKQAELCEVLAQRRSLRAELLTANGYGSRDLLVALLANTPKAEHDSAVATFGAFVSAAERAQAEIDVNREFFAVALAAVEDALAAASPESRKATYDGTRRRPGGSIMVETTS